jgi:hypothetical protein
MKNVNVQVVIQNVRLSFPCLFNPRVSPGAEAGAKPKYSASFLLHKKNNAEAIKALTSAMQKVLEEKGVKPAQLRSKCLREAVEVVSSETGEPYAGYDADHVVLSTSSVERIIVCDQRNNPVTEEDSLFYAGCYVDAAVNIYLYDKVPAHGKRLVAQLTHVRFRRDGEAFGAKKKDAAQVFGAPVEEENASEGLL